ncbi:MAG: twin-arginine translocation signal domain-containing protein, partial [Candidatus Methylomirabilales bacterium]
MKKSDGEERQMVKKAMGRRTFLKVTGVAAGALATGGLAGILEARRAPAFAQGTKLHILRWTDFI